LASASAPAAARPTVIDRQSLQVFPLGLVVALARPTDAVTARVDLDAWSDGRTEDPLARTRPDRVELIATSGRRTSYPLAIGTDRTQDKKGPFRIGQVGGTGLVLVPMTPEVQEIDLVVDDAVVWKIVRPAIPVELAEVSLAPTEQSRPRSVRWQLRQPTTFTYGFHVKLGETLMALDTTHRDQGEVSLSDEIRGDAGPDLTLAVTDGFSVVTWILRDAVELPTKP
jgi:hypothetical protein